MGVTGCLRSPGRSEIAAATLRAAVDQESIHRQQQLFETDRRVIQAPPGELERL